MKAIRMSAAGIVFQQDKILLIRYKNQEGTFLVGPGGGALPEEDLLTGLKREVFEETRLNVNPGKMLFVEDLLASKYRIIKVWFLCTVIDGTLTQTEEADIEGIVDASWYSKEQLSNETVYPEILKSIEWQRFFDEDFQTIYFPLKKVNF